MKYQTLFYGGKKSKCHLLKFLPNMLSVKDRQENYLPFVSDNFIIRLIL